MLQNSLIYPLISTTDIYILWNTIVDKQQENCAYIALSKENNL